MAGVYRHPAVRPPPPPPYQLFAGFLHNPPGAYVIPAIMAGRAAYQRAPTIFPTQPPRMSAEFLAAEATSFQIPDASDEQYQRRPPPQTRIPPGNFLPAAFLDNPPQPYVIPQFAKTAADAVYFRPPPHPTRLPGNKVQSVFLDNPPGPYVIPQPKPGASDAAYFRPPPAPTRQVFRSAADVLASATVLSMTASFTFEGLSAAVVISQPAKVTWTNSTPPTTTWTAPLS